ncbi:MAG: InlB B-repeat-containing protein [Eubacterium sp.]
MRCKNCGSENDDNLYICQNCGSPLYDEDEEINEQNGETQVFSALDDEYNKPARSSSNKNDISNDDKNKKKKQQTIAIIIILAVILISIIIGVIVAVASKSNQEETTASTEATTISTTNETTKESTTLQTTTESTTESTTKATTTTTTTTEATTYTVTLSCNDGGEVNGDGTYKRGENVTVVAKPADSYEFDGWYKGSSKVSSNTKYTFTVTGDSNLEAVFVLVNEEIDIVDGGTD